ncbi:uncharacterized protein LOC105638290 [Jatropha curcas]|uniref:uncharacterized protein LOC105638290 n=1 Tax=Jatropha curcas TaxID=180498 RepID=UPI00189532A5|nr:uncharacterized protein LOC105638290 [Jatropha curcas]
MDKETELLSRLAANHLHLAQFEPLRAILIALRSKNPELALAILQTLVANSGRFENILWSPSCPSPSLLTYLSTLELLEYSNSTSRTWSFDPGILRLRAEFLLLIQVLSDMVTESMRKNVDLESIEREKENDDFSEKEELLGRSEDLKDGSDELGDCLRVLDKVLELGVKRLKPDIRVDSDDTVNEEAPGSKRTAGSAVPSIEEGEIMCLRRAILEHADVFEALCWNIQQQLKGDEVEKSGLAITVRRDEKVSMDILKDIAEDEEEATKLLTLIQRSVQLAHLDAVKKCLGVGDEEGAFSHIRYLYLDRGVEEAEYRTVLQDLLVRVLSRREEYGDSRGVMQEKLLCVYREALSSNCGQIVGIIQVIQDDLLRKEIGTSRTLDNSQIPPPLERFQKYLKETRMDADSTDPASSLNVAVSFCMRDMYHYARVSGLHVLECIMDMALSAVKREQLQEASNVLMLFPRLRPLVAVMGWDLLSGKTTARRKLMQLLWTSSKSQVFRLEESSLYSNQMDEISCVEHLCDSLCYQLDLASFVACVNSGQAWNSRSSLLLSGNQQIISGDEVNQAEPFVENFVLERLSVQSPLLVLFDVVPIIKFQDAIELISMQPIASTVSAWKRMQDIELMHMRYALESIILALGIMERSTNDEKESHHQSALCHLKDLKNHLEAITNIPRKILMVNVIISLLHMDDISLNLTHCASPGSNSESHSACPWELTNVTTCEGGNELVISFTGLLLDILHRNLPPGIIEEHALNDTANSGGRQALDWRISIAKHFIEDWQWRLSILQRLLPLSERQWKWKEALTVLRAAPSKLLNLCMQRAKYDIGEEAVHRFSLSAEDRATLELAEWVDGAFRRASESRLVEDTVSRAADGTSSGQDLDFSSLRSQLGPLAAVLLCIDIAATCARSGDMSQQLLDQAQVMLSEIYPGGSPKTGYTYWDQIHEVGIISVSRRILKRLHELLEQDDNPGLQQFYLGMLLFSNIKGVFGFVRGKRTCSCLCFIR